MAGWWRLPTAWASLQQALAQDRSVAVVPDPLDRDRPVQTVVPGEEDLAHAAAAENPDDSVGADVLAAAGGTCGFRHGDIS